MDQTVANQLVAMLPPEDRRQLLDRCEFVEVTALADPQLLQGRTDYAYFPTDSVISVLTPIDSRHELEIGAVGREGVFGAHYPIDARNPELRAIIQAAGHAWRISSGALQRVAEASEQLHATLHNYLRVVLTQTGRHAACCRFHNLPQRLARWLLTHADCGATSDVLVTHSSLAVMLGSQRAGITVAAGQFEREGLISSGRGHIVVLDRPGLMQATCSCYLINRKIYEQGMKPTVPA